MNKQKDYKRVKLDSKAFSELDEALGPEPATKKRYITFGVDFGSSGKWDFDTLSEFLASAGQESANYCAHAPDQKAHIIPTVSGCTAIVEGKDARIYQTCRCRPRQTRGALQTARPTTQAKTCRKTNHTPIIDGSLPFTAIPRAVRRTGRSLSRGARAAMPPSVPPPSAAA